MRILILNFSDIQGGAARAAYRLHKALLVEGIESKMLVQIKSGDDFTVVGPETKINKALAKLRPFLDSIPVVQYKNRTKTQFSANWVPFSGIVDRINEINPDIVHLHWISGGMMSIKEIGRIQAPVVWSLHDMWVFTGGCHYDEECGGYKNLCGKCKALGSKKSNDLSAKILRRKRKHLANSSNFHFIGLSKWLEKSLSESSLFHNKLIYNLPNPIETSVFSPIDKSAARELLNLPKDKRIVMFGGMGATGDPRKGFNELSAALQQLKTDHVELAVFGSNQPKNPQPFKFKTHYLGYLHDDISLKILYNAADVMIVPSLQENLSNVIMESLSCGTPVVAFNTGGNSDMIDHLKNGYLAQPFDSTDLANGITWVLNNEGSNELAVNARNKIIDEFDSKLVAKKYIALYKSILDSK